MATVTMYKYLQDLQAKGYNRIPDEFRLPNLIDIYQENEELKAEQKMLGDIIAKLRLDLAGYEACHNTFCE